MNVIKVIKEFKENYPGKNIIKNINDNPTEIICELGLNAKGQGVAISVIDKSILHYHKKMTEIYNVLKGNLKVYKNDKEFMLKEGQSITISPGEVHYAIGNETWIEVLSSPPWSQDDHFVIV